MAYENINEVEECVKSYFGSLKNLEPLTKEEEHIYLKKYKEKGDIEARDKVIMSNLKYTCKITSSYRGRGIDFSDLIEEANDALIESIDKFDIKQDVKIMSYAKWWIMQRMQTLVKNANKIKSAELPNENDTSNFNDSDGELKCENYNNHEKNDVFADTFDDEYENENRSMFVSKITEDLNGRERDMVYLYYGIYGDKPLTLEEIGDKYSLTKERTRQIIEKAMLKIRSATILLDYKYV